jgi:hypothetical protein
MSRPRGDHDKGRRAPGIILGPNTDPPTASSSRKPVLAGSIFDQARLLDGLRRGTVQGIPELEHPSDELLIATVMELGMPRWSADQMRYNPMLRLCYVRTWLDVKAAAAGDPEAKERIDVIRTYFVEARQLELVTDRPDMSVGFWER